jgi:hypothetical protein
MGGIVGVHDPSLHDALPAPLHKSPEKSASIDFRKRDGCCMIYQITSSYGGQARSIRA